MIVIAILGLLVAIAVPHYVRQRSTTQANTCINNLMKIDQAVSQFAIEKGKKTGDAVAYPADLTPYIRLNLNQAIPACPAGGGYVMAAVGSNPTCSLGATVDPAHVLP